MNHIARRICAILAATVIAATVAGCSKTTKPPADAVLTQDDADDLVQMAAMTIGSDKGGWLVDIQTTLEIVPLPPPLAVASYGSKRALPAASVRRNPGAPSALLETSKTIGGMNYSFFHYAFNTRGDSLAEWTSADTLEEVNGISAGTGTIVDGTTFNGFLRHIGDPFSATSFEPESTLINFTGAGDDSLYATFTPKFRTTARIYSATGYSDYDVYVQRNPATNAFPLQGQASVYLIADRLRSADPNDIDATVEGEITITFDGTRTPVVGITNNLDDPRPQFKYKIDLKTGVITERVP